MVRREDTFDISWVSAVMLILLDGGIQVFHGRYQPFLYLGVTGELHQGGRSVGSSFPVVLTGEVPLGYRYYSLPEGLPDERHVFNYVVADHANGLYQHVSLYPRVGGWSLRVESLIMDLPGFNPFGAGIERPVRFDREDPL